MAEDPVEEATQAGAASLAVGMAALQGLQAKGAPDWIISSMEAAARIAALTSVLDPATRALYEFRAGQNMVQAAERIEAAAVEAHRESVAPRLVIPGRG